MVWSTVVCAVFAGDERKFNHPVFTKVRGRGRKTQYYNKNTGEWVFWYLLGGSVFNGCNSMTNDSFEYDECSSAGDSFASDSIYSDTSSHDCSDCSSGGDF